MASATVAFNAIVVEALNEHNYEDWSSQIETYLLSKDIWDVVKEEAPESDNGGNWRRRNAEALHAIKVCCGKESFSLIRKSGTAKIAWEILEKNFNTTTSSQEKDEVEDTPLIHTPTDDAGRTHNYPEEEIVADDDLENQGNDYGEKLKLLFGYVENGDVDQMKKLLEEPAHDLLRAKDQEKGCTALQLAVSCGHQSVVEELVNLMSPEDLEIKETTTGNTCTALHIAAHKGNSDILELLMAKMRPEGLGLQNSRGETALHNLAQVNELNPVDLIRKMRGEDLEIVDNEGYTAVGRFLANEPQSFLDECYRCGVLIEIFKVKNRKIFTSVCSPNNYIPVLEACARSRWSLCYAFYDATSIEALLPGNEDESLKGSQGAQLLNMCFRHPKGLEMACELLRRSPKLAFIPNVTGSYPLSVLARLHYAFFHERSLTPWQKWIYNCITLPNEDEDEKLTRLLWKLMFYLVLKFLGYSHLAAMKWTHCEVLDCMGIITKNKGRLAQEELNIVRDSVLRAIEHGHIGFVKHMCNAYPRLVDTNSSQDLFQHSIMYRQAEIYILLYGLKKERRYEIGQYVADFRDSLLHVAAKYSSLKRSNREASLEMQTELRWFKEVESIVPFETHDCLDARGLTARLYRESRRIEEKGRRVHQTHRNCLHNCWGSYCYHHVCGSIYSSRWY